MHHGSTTMAIIENDKLGQDAADNAPIFTSARA
jgi:hypothetical protein